MQSCGLAYPGAIEVIGTIRIAAGNIDLMKRRRILTQMKEGGNKKFTAFLQGCSTYDEASYFRALDRGDGPCAPIRRKQGGGHYDGRSDLDFEAAAVDRHSASFGEFVNISLRLQAQSV